MTDQLPAAAKSLLGGLLRRASRQMAVAVEARFAAADVNFTQWSALRLLEHNGSMKASELALAMEITTGAMTRVVDGLEGRGLVARKRSVSDRRSVDLSLTADGRSALTATFPVFEQRWESALQGLSEFDVDTLIRLLVRLTRTIERDGGDSPQITEN